MVIKVKLGIKKNTILTILITAIITAFLTSTVKDAIDLLLINGNQGKMSAVSKMLKDYCIYDVDEEKMKDYALMGMTAAAGDPYTAYYPKDEFESYKDNVYSSYIGIGATLGADIETNQLLVISPMEDSPAEAAGLKAGDVIKSVDGISYTAYQLSEVATYLKKGDVGSEVVLTVLRDGKELEITIARDKIVKISVKSKMMKNNIAYMRITGFEIGNGKDSKSTYEEFCEHLDALKTAGMSGLIIDLRDNPGGDFDSVCKIADKILPEGLITYTEDKNGKRNDVKSNGECLDVPIVVLINGGSASASEILTGALKDNKKATVVGTKSYGKGIVQSVYSFADGSGISITTSKYYTPSGVCIHDIGIEPDVEVELNTKKAISELELSEDTQLKKALELLGE